MQFDFRGAAVSRKDIQAGIKKLKNVVDAVADASLDDEYAAMAVMDNVEILEQSSLLAKHFKDCDLLIVIGIGGSNLGAMAVAKAALGNHYERTHSPSVRWADTVDANYLEPIIAELELAVKEKKNVCLNVISKSGTTTETAAVFATLLDIVKKLPDYKDHVIVTTDKYSELWKLARKLGFHSIEIPKNVGGRYSVFTPVGLFPLAVMGIDIIEFWKGAIAACSYCCQADAKNPALVGAITLAHYHKIHGCDIHDTFVFGHQLEDFGKWYRQLLGESIGKAVKSGKTIKHVGITPTVSVGSVDLHSVGQLYIDGPRDKITTFVEITKEYPIRIPALSRVCLVDNLNGRSMNEVMDAITSGVKTAYRKEDIPFISIKLPDCNEKIMGELMMTKMLETIYLCKLLDVNPFNQPAVEKYKKVTRQILAGKRGK